MVPSNAGSKVPVRIPMPENINAVPAKEKATGKPASSTKQMTANIMMGINSTIFQNKTGFKNFRKTLQS